MSQRPSASAPGGGAPGPAGDGKSDVSKKKRRPSNRSNRPIAGVRVKLPALETFQKEVIFK